MDATDEIVSKLEKIQLPESNSENELIQLPELDANCKQREVPSSRIGRFMQFSSLFAGVSVGAVYEYAKGTLGWNETADMKSSMLSEQNVERIVDKLCHLRGAALKLGQIVSMQDPKVVSPQLIDLFERVRKYADYMPNWQVEKILSNEYGGNWRSKFKSFTDKPFAAASIGQVHRGVLHDGTEIAIKIQYMDIAQSIESDINNLVGILKYFSLFPPNMFIDDVIDKVKKQLAYEVDYLRESDFQKKYGTLIAEHKHKEYYVPKVYDDLTTKTVLVTELVPGTPIDECFELDYEHRKMIGTSLLRLCFLELFELRCIQSDSNWSNFLYDAKTNRIMLLDFGASQFYTEEFIENYKQYFCATVEGDRDRVRHLLIKMKFLAENENDSMIEGQLNISMMFGELFREDEEFDFGVENLTERLSVEATKVLENRSSPPPEEFYSINRKMSGILTLCSKLAIKVNCHKIYKEFVTCE